MITTNYIINLKNLNLFKLLVVFLLLSCEKIDWENGEYKPFDELVRKEIYTPDPFKQKGIKDRIQLIRESENNGEFYFQYYKPNQPIWKGRYKKYDYFSISMKELDSLYCKLK